MGFRQKELKIIMKNFKFKFAQTSLEIALAICLAIVLVVATMSVWSWFNKTMVERMDTYKSTRHMALTSSMGLQAEYTPEPFDIFGFSSMKEGPGDQDPNLTDDIDYQACYDDFDATIEESLGLVDDAMAKYEEANELKLEYTELRAELGKMWVMILDPEIPWPFNILWISRFDMWLFTPFGVKYFYETEWDNIKLTFSLWLAASGLNFIECLLSNIEELFTAGLYINITAILDIISECISGGLDFVILILDQPNYAKIYSDYINKGIDLEAQCEDATAQAQQLEKESYLLQVEAVEKLIDCLTGSLPPGNPCVEDCYEQFGKYADALVAQAKLVCAGGDEYTCMDTLAQAQSWANQYMACLQENCGSGYNYTGNWSGPPF